MTVNSVAGLDRKGLSPYVLMDIQHRGLVPSGHQAPGSFKTPAVSSHAGGAVWPTENSCLRCVSFVQRRQFRVVIY